VSRRGDERLVVAFATITCGIAALTYLAHVPRQSGVGPRAAAATAAAPAQPGRSGAHAPRNAWARPAVPARAAMARPTTPEVELSITLWPHGPQRGRRSWTISCPPGTAACRAAEGRLRILATEPTGPCGAVRPRDAEAIITGYVGGRYVTAWIDQRDGCGVRRWQGLRPLLTPPKERQSGAQRAVRTG